MNQVRMCANPQAAVQNIINQNPNLQQLMSMNGGNLQQIAQAMAAQRGIDLNQLISALQS